MAWLEAHQELGRHRKTKALARILSISRAEAVGHLLFMWWWALDHAPKGDLRKFSVEEIAEESGWDGDAQTYVDALHESGWLDKGPRVHDWDDYAGRLISQREKAKERTRTHRARSGDVTRNERVTNAQRMRLQDTTQHNTTEQELARAADLFEEFWKVYPRREGKGAARKAFVTAAKRFDTWGIIAAALRYRDDPNRDPAFTAHPATWLNRDGWDDDPLPSRSEAKRSPGAEFARQAMTAMEVVR